ncbi:MAG: prenyltransferase [Gammaproteobacteria bacterium]|nr:prenyltransferase [Gammaproteobacteria bacterium]
MFVRKLTDKKIKKIHDAVSNAPDSDDAWKVLSPLIKVQSSNEVAADALIDIVRNGHLTIEQSLDLLSEIYEAHKDNDDIVILISGAMEAGRDLNYLNDPPPEHSLFGRIIKRLSEMTLVPNDPKKEALIVEGLSCTARLMARQYDSIAERSYARLVELLPSKSWAHYNQGLFFKTRGRFADGVLANQKAIELADKSSDSYKWNMGICATGSGQGEVALKIWKEIGQKIEIGRFDLPEGGYPSCKVRLAQRPLSQRDADHDEPGLEETIWIERLSPCHGIIRSVLFQELGVDYGDVILFDGAPITYHKYGDQQIAVFPHLATIRKNNYQFFDFAGTQGAKGELGNISNHLEKDAVIYSHTENYSVLCATCWRNETIDHEHKESEEKNVVTGRIAVPPDIKPKDILNKIDSALKDLPECRIFSPDLCRAAGLEDRARIEERRFNMLRSTLE